MTQRSYPENTRGRYQVSLWITLLVLRKHHRQVVDGKGLTLDCSSFVQCSRWPSRS